MSRSAWFSHVRLWICLALLLATNLANVIDGFELADVAKCVCEDAGLDENGIQFLLAGKRIGTVTLQEGDFISVQVEQTAISPQSVRWNLLESASRRKFPGTITLLSEEGVSTTLRLETEKFVPKRSFHFFIVSFEESEKTVLGSISVLLKTPEADIRYGEPHREPIFVPRLPVDKVLRIHVNNSNPDRNWQVVSLKGAPPGLDFSPVSKINAKLFEVSLRGILPPERGPVSPSHCSTLVAKLEDQDSGTVLDPYLLVYSSHQGVPGCR